MCCSLMFLPSSVRSTLSWERLIGSCHVTRASGPCRVRSFLRTTHLPMISLRHGPDARVTVKVFLVTMSEAGEKTSGPQYLVVIGYGVPGRTVVDLAKERGVEV